MGSVLDTPLTHQPHRCAIEDGIAFSDRTTGAAPGEPPLWTGPRPSHLSIAWKPQPCAVVTGQTPAKAGGLADKHAWFADLAKHVEPRSRRTHRLRQPERIGLLGRRTLSDGLDSTDVSATCRSRSDGRYVPAGARPRCFRAPEFHSRIVTPIGWRAHRLDGSVCRLRHLDTARLTCGRGVGASRSREPGCLSLPNPRDYSCPVPGCREPVQGGCEPHPLPDRSTD
jgi:hypothetical protein